MNNLFTRTSALWAKYDKYEYRTATDGREYLTPCQDASLSACRPLKDAQKLVMDALDIGLLASKNEQAPELKDKILTFATNYGLLGMMTALPTTPDFITYEAVYLPKNHFIKAESMTTEEYLSYFFPFEQIYFHKKGMESSWTVDDTDMVALTLALKDKPQALLMSFQKEYAEPYHWLVQQFQDWAFTFLSSYLYYQDKEELLPEQEALYREGIRAYGGIAPTYHIELTDERPQIVWDFHSLLLCVQMMLSFMITDEKSPLKVCKHCAKVFVSSRSDNIFCSGKCKNQYNVYKSRKRDQTDN